MYKLLLCILCSLFLLQLFSVVQVQGECCLGIVDGNYTDDCNGVMEHDDFWKHWKCADAEIDIWGSGECDICIATWTGGALAVFVCLPLFVGIAILICIVLACRRRRHHTSHNSHSVHGATIVANTAPYQTLPTHDFGHHHHHHHQSSHHGGHH
ncbi:hypothetical protein DFA_09986 [Cavenderia fasciculata]|uniref:Transmembrane protein n=1 Tax=Cavenderia fasciculata TaxID=261658 RepID=F4Q8Z1_CACFS|nr:uncharacterized protein DFA_09986 [Cavenderia fasciculata]EGG15160.1 hypothetical protein DFA_09986 [Cavenderia fasciculata]|eukprot:XP_004351880.1 hypothetical protein DFA_09986 [Cavenderia fasciculata]